MKEALPLRKPTEIDQEYSTICTQIGDRVFKIDCLQAEINAYRERCRQLDEEKRASSEPQDVEEPK